MGRFFGVDRGMRFDFVLSRRLRCGIVVLYMKIFYGKYCFDEVT